MLKIQVKSMEAEFQQRIHHVQQLAFEEKARMKERMNGKLMENLEACKAHGGPITKNDLHKLDSLTYEELSLEVGYLKKTIAPKLRFRRKVDNKFVKYSAEQLRQQLRDVIKPTNESSPDINALLQTALGNDALTTICETTPSSVEPGTHGLWRGPLDETVFGVSLDSSSLQTYKERRFGYVPDGLPQPLEEWTLTETFSDNQFSYIERGSMIFIVLNSC